MSADSSPDPSQPESKQINLQQVAGQFMAGLQRHFDMLAFNIASGDAVTETAYDQQCALPRIMPVAPAHQNFEQMQAYARDLLVRQVVGDSLNLAVTAMNHAHFFLALIQSSGAGRHPTAEQQKLAQNAQKDFVPLQLDKKFNVLEKKFGIICELEDSVTSLGFMLQALLQHKGQVQAVHANDSGELVLELKALKISHREKGDQPPKGRLADIQKVFREGEYIHLSSAELQLVFVMIAAFADALFKSVVQYARTNRDGS
ncbi:MAG: hypothetical protein CNE95_04290 [Puniceicoccaceae bacterium MED-G30]|jgi:hypothetical protein|nr:MAG: hypothetical protein CNE95_04290 [Puniceicoccaceae bacterium MED-G30]|tara:strand:+ start:5054 stop:5830 length:777 start_codon:yes stop_codon:yes gene_type:complete